MNKQKLLEQIEEQIKTLNPKYAKDIIFGLNIAKDIINKSDIDTSQKEINDYINDNIWEIIRNNIDTAREIVLN